MSIVTINPGLRSRVDTIHDEVDMAVNDPITTILDNCDEIVDAFISINDKRGRDQGKDITQLCGTYDPGPAKKSSSEGGQQSLVAPSGGSRGIVVPANTVEEVV
jgi:hypothetical protein